MKRYALLAATAALLPVAPAHAVAPNVITVVNSTYAPGDVTVIAGGSLTFVNTDPIPHDITAVDDTDGDGTLDFQAKASERGTPGSVVQVPNVATLEPGYHQFYCLAHEYMRGTIRIVPPV